MRLVTDARNWWKWHSTYVFAALGVFPVVWLNSPDLQTLVPATLVSKIAPCMAVLGFLVRLHDQGLKIPPPKQAPGVQK